MEKSTHAYVMGKAINYEGPIYFWKYTYNIRNILIFESCSMYFIKKLLHGCGIKESKGLEILLHILSDYPPSYSGHIVKVFTNQYLCDCELVFCSCV